MEKIIQQQQQKMPEHKTWNLCAVNYVFEVHEISIKCFVVIRSVCLLLPLSREKNERKWENFRGKIY